MKSFSLSWPQGVTDALLPILYDVEAMSGIENYSDLESQQIGLSLGASYAFSPRLQLTAQASYDEFIDDEAYVYGDQDGTMYSGTAGMIYTF